MQSLQEFFIVAEENHVNIPSLGLALQFSAGPIKEEEPDRNRFVVGSQASDTLKPLMLPTAVGEVGERIID